MVPGMQSYGLVITPFTATEDFCTFGFFDLTIEPVRGEEEFEDLFIELRAA